MKKPMAGLALLMLVATMATAGGGPASAEPAGDGRKTVRHTVTLKPDRAAKPFGSGPSAEKSTRTARSVAQVDPILCHNARVPDDLALDLTLDYDNNALVGVKGEFKAGGNCGFTADWPGSRTGPFGTKVPLSGDHAVGAVAMLKHNSDYVRQGNAAYCAGSTSNKCVQTTSTGTYTCTGPSCAGTYQVHSYVQLSLGPDHVWRTFSPDECTALDEKRTILCHTWTDTITVGATPPA
jgi:hypothetical protein